MRGAPSHKRAAQAGMTLVEVMMAMVLTAILLVGMNALWVEITREVDALVLRQKAIFRLNGEMERLTGLYAAGSTAVTPAPTGSVVAVSDYNTTGAPVNRGDYIGTTIVPAVASGAMWQAETSENQRFIYPDPTVLPVWMVDAAAFEEPLDTGSKQLTYGSTSDKSFDTIYRRTLYWTGAGPSDGDDRNVVWIDREKSIVGQISWSSAILDSLTYPCDNGSGSQPCRHITLYLDYPFRYSSGTSPKEEIPGLPVSTITLQTIVSRRP